MKRLILLRHTGANATNLVIAERLARKLRGALRQGECVLVDCEDVEPTQEFLDVLLKDAQPEKVKFCGLPIMRQVTLALRMPEREEKS